MLSIRVFHLIAPGLFIQLSESSFIFLITTWKSVRCVNLLLNNPNSDFLCSSWKCSFSCWIAGFSNTGSIFRACPKLSVSYPQLLQRKTRSVVAVKTRIPPRSFCFDLLGEISPRYSGIKPGRPRAKYIRRPGLVLSQDVLKKWSRLQKSCYVNKKVVPRK